MFLKTHTQTYKYDMQTSNIADYIYIGIASTVDTLGPLLKPFSENKHATLITLFMNVLNFFQCMKAPLLTPAALRQAGQYLGVEPWQWPTSIMHPTLLIANEITLCLANADFWFGE